MFDRKQKETSEHIIFYSNKDQQSDQKNQKQKSRKYNLFAGRNRGVLLSIINFLFLIIVLIVYLNIRHSGIILNENNFIYTLNAKRINKKQDVEISFSVSPIQKKTNMPKPSKIYGDKISLRIMTEKNDIILFINEYLVQPNCKYDQNKNKYIFSINISDINQKQKLKIILNFGQNQEKLLAYNLR